MRRQLMSIFMLLGLLLAFGASKAQAQVVGSVEADIPFQFHAGDAKFAPGKYTVRMLDDSDLMIMEISSADTRHSALFQVRQTEAKMDPAKTELVFNQYGDNYFLSQVFDEGNKYGSEVLESHYEKMMKKGGGQPVEHRIRGRHRAHARKA